MARTSRKTQNTLPAQADPVLRIWKTALYVRLSVEDNGKIKDSDSIESQIALLEEYVSSKPYLKKAALFTDNGFTGTNFSRPAFTQMMEAVQAGKVDCIIVKDLSRLGRNYIETSQFIEKLCPFYALRFIAVNDNYDTEAITNTGQLSASLSNIINDYYAKDISRKVISAIQAKMESGDYIGNYAPYGYRKDPHNKNHLIVDPQAAPIIRQIFEWRAENMSYMGINKKLNEAGILSPSQYKRTQGIITNRNQTERTILWNKHMITIILNNMVYIGHTAQKKCSACLYKGIPYHITEKSEWIIVKNTHEPLISEELFEKVQQINRESIEKCKACHGKYDYLPKADNIYGKKFFCAECGATMKLVRSFSTKKDKAYFTFKCPTYMEHKHLGCKDVKIRQEDLNKAIFAFIRSQMDLYLDTEQTLHSLLALKKAKPKQNNSQQKIKLLRQKLANKQSLLSSLYMDLKENILSQEEYTDHRAILMEDSRMLSEEIARLETAADWAEKQLSREMQWKKQIERFEHADHMTAELAEAFIESVSIHEDKSLDIKLSYRDELTLMMQICQKLRKESA